MVTGIHTLGGLQYHFNEAASGASGWYYDAAAWKWNYQAAGAVPTGALIR
ncbi:MAG: hypothetical protein IIY96_04220 [Lachnospiraceae bacterium]|nr:hypothetical protein [Lachnospiraceae bacterium]